MMLFMENMWTPLLLMAISGVGRVRLETVCEIPQNLNHNVHIIPLKHGNATSNRFLVNCPTGDWKLFPLGEYNDIYCENDIWKKSGHVADDSEINLLDIQCVYMCADPAIENGGYKLDDTYLESYHKGRFSMKSSGGQTLYLPGVTINLHCDDGFSLNSRHFKIVCGEGGDWTPSVSSCLHGEATTKRVESGVSVDPNNTLIISTTVSVIAFVSCVVIMVTIAVRAKWRVVCRKRRVPTSHPDDINYPHGYTQLGSGSLLPSYAEATEDNDEYGVHSHNHSGVYSVYRPTTTSDYRQLSLLESSSRESESLSAGSHRHSLFSGSSSNYRTTTGGDNISDILLQGDHLSMSDTSTLVTVNTYESNHTASNPSLTNSRRGIAGSMNSNTTTSMDDAPLIVRSHEDIEDESAETQRTQAC